MIKDFVEVEAFPQDLPHDITIDISVIQTINDTICVKDLKVSNKVEILDDAEQVIVTILSMEEETEETPAAAATPEASTPTAASKPAKDDKKEEKHAGPRAKEQVKEKLLQLIEQIENSNKG